MLYEVITDVVVEQLCAEVLQTVVRGDVAQHEAHAVDDVRLRIDVRVHRPLLLALADSYNFV